MKELRDHISEIYDGAAWEPITGLLWENGSPWQLHKFEQDVVYDGQLWRCVIITKTVFDPDSPDAVDYAEDIYSEMWVI